MAKQEHRPRIESEKGTVAFVRAIGTKHDLEAPEVYGEAFEFVLEHSDDFEEWLAG